MKQEKTSEANNPDDGDQFNSDNADSDIPLLRETVDSEAQIDDVDSHPAFPPSGPNKDMPTNLENPMVESKENGIASGNDTRSPTDPMEDPEDPIHTLSLQEAILDEEQSQNIATLEAIVFDGDDPNAPAPKSITSAAKQSENPAKPEPASANTLEPATSQTQPVTPITLTPVPAAATPSAKPLPQKSENPFLPQHILDRLNSGKRNLVEEIAQSGAALDASTAMLRTRARAERMHKPSFSDESNHKTNSNYPRDSRDKSAHKKQQLVDELVDEYLPLLASELRRRLRKILDE